mmetsp:Transcript_15357/g.38818  ORF Transcript_15357/g.38818 Transcript_15357/m.38818 type:complete len:116 (+) Transcript_15357:2177-2524(+)
MSASSHLHICTRHSSRLPPAFLPPIRYMRKTSEKKAGQEHHVTPALIIAPIIAPLSLSYFPSFLYLPYTYLNMRYDYIVRAYIRTHVYPCVCVCACAHVWMSTGTGMGMNECVYA